MIEVQRAAVGPGFRELKSALPKKPISHNIYIHDAAHHVVCHFKLDDALPTPAGKAEPRAVY